MRRDACAWGYLLYNIFRLALVPPRRPLWGYRLRNRAGGFRGLRRGWVFARKSELTPKSELNPKVLETLRGRARQTLCKVSLQEPQLPFQLLNSAFDLVDASFLLPRDVVPGFSKFHLKNNEVASVPALCFCRFCYFICE